MRVFVAHCYHLTLRSGLTKEMLHGVKIPDIARLPDACHAAEWARLLSCNPSTIYRAEQANQLRRSPSRGSRALYSKREILRWLGLSALAASK
jgi:hypothetical protein